MENILEINDRVYGNFTIKEPILLNLINSYPLQRLKKINQLGLPQKFYPFYPGYSRYEHSLGVMLILKRLGSDLEEQVAGLIHDVSHTAFSHLFDWVIENRKEEDSQDNNLERIVLRSEIPSILKKYGLDVRKIINVKEYKILEKPIPHLCADRIDYSLREFKMWANPHIVNQCLNDLFKCKDQIIFKTKDSAEKFARTYAKLQRESWGGKECTVRWEIFARALKVALKENLIEISDFDKTDEYLIKKLNQSVNEEIKRALKILERPRLRLKENKQNPQFNLKKKFRYVDPSYIEKGKLYTLSGTDLEYSSLLEKEREINEEGIKVDLMD